MSQFFLKRGDRTLGPFTVDQLKVSAQKGQIKSSDQIAQTIEGPWTQADQVKGLNLDSQNPIGPVVTDPLGIGEPVAELESVQGQGNQEQSMPDLGGLAMPGSGNSNIGDILDEILVKAESQSSSESEQVKLVETPQLTTMKISREWAKVDMLRAYKVVLDGKVIGKIKNDETRDFRIPSGSHELSLKIDWCRSNTIGFTAGSASTTFSCGSNATNGASGLIYIVFLRSKYLWLSHSRF